MSQLSSPFLPSHSCLCAQCADTAQPSAPSIAADEKRGLVLRYFAGEREGQVRLKPACPTFRISFG